MVGIVVGGLGKSPASVRTVVAVDKGFAFNQDAQCRDIIEKYEVISPFIDRALFFVCFMIRTVCQFGYCTSFMFHQ